MGHWAQDWIDQCGEPLVNDAKYGHVDRIMKRTRLDRSDAKDLAEDIRTLLKAEAPMQDFTETTTPEPTPSCDEWPPMGMGDDIIWLDSFPHESNEPKIHLIIPDAHVKPGQDLRRFDWLRSLIEDVDPDTVVCLGDLADMPSLSSYDKGRKSFEGRRYVEDVEVVKDAQERLWSGISWEGKKIILDGNHENRITRMAEATPEFEYLVDVESLDYSVWWDEVVPFKEVVVIDGIAYCHFFISGIMSRAIGGINSAASILNKGHMSATAGHSHLRDYSEKTTWDGRKIQGLVAGCYLEHYEKFAGPANALWWSGITIKHEVLDGTYEPEFMSIDMIRKRYGR